MNLRRINMIDCNVWRSSVFVALAAICAASGCWREVEYTPPESGKAAEQEAPSMVDQVAGETDPAAPTTPIDSPAEDDSKATASEFGEDLAAVMSAEEAAKESSEATGTTPITESTPPPASVVGERYAAETAAEPPATESAEPTTPAAPDALDSLFGEPVESNTPPDSPVSESMLPEQREAIAESSETPIPNLDDDDIQTPPAMEAWTARRAAWLLGSKLSLAALANEHGAPAVEVQKLFGQSSALAKKLGIPLGDLPARAAASVARPASDLALDYLFTEGQKIGGALATQKGAEYAALFEVAVKSNILLVIYKPGVPATEAIAAAIEKAAARAKLPETLTRPLLDALAAKATMVDVRKAVYELHAATDKYLDETAPR